MISLFSVARSLRKRFVVLKVAGASISTAATSTSTRDTQDVEPGLAAMAAFLNNRLLLGYDVNLQADEMV